MVSEEPKESKEERLLKLCKELGVAKLKYRGLEVLFLDASDQSDESMPKKPNHFGIGVSKPDPLRDNPMVYESKVKDITDKLNTGLNL